MLPYKNELFSYFTSNLLVLTQQIFASTKGLLSPIKMYRNSLDTYGYNDDTGKVTCKTIRQNSKLSLQYNHRYAA